MQLNLQKQTHPGPVEEVLQRALDATRAPRTRRAYLYDLRGFTDWLAGTGEALARHSVQRYLAGQTGSKPQTLNRKLAAIRKFVREAAECGWLDAVEAERICAIPSLPVLGTSMGNWLSGDQIMELLSSMTGTEPHDIRDRLTISLLLFSALRHEELQKLTVGQIQRRERRRCIVNLRGKGGRVRTVALPARIEPDLDAWIAILAELHAQQNAPAVQLADTPLIRRFHRCGKELRPGATQIGYGHISEIVEQAGRRIGVPALRPHDLRRTFIKRAHDNGASIQQIQLAVGHASLTTTQVYLQSIPDMKNPACDFVG